jgi:hypothetical protein
MRRGSMQKEPLMGDYFLFGPVLIRKDVMRAGDTRRMMFYNPL